MGAACVVHSKENYPQGNAMVSAQRGRAGVAGGHGDRPYLRRRWRERMGDRCGTRTGTGNQAGQQVAASAGDRLDGPWGGRPNGRVGPTKPGDWPATRVREPTHADARELANKRDHGRAVELPGSERKDARPGARSDDRPAGSAAEERPAGKPAGGVGGRTAGGGNG